jgi:type II secretory pathway component PulF
MRRGLEFRKKLISSLIYPICLMVLVFVVIMGFSFFVIPMFENFLKDLGGETPTLLKALNKFAKSMKYLGPITIVTVIATIIVLPIIRKNPNWRRRTDYILLKIPSIGPVVTLAARTNLANVLGTLLSNGVTTSEALELAQVSIPNTVILGKFLGAKIDILNGEAVCSSFEKYGIFDGEACDFIAVGEKTGDLASAFRYVYGALNVDLAAAMRRISLSVTSIVMVIAFAFVAIFALSVVQLITGAMSAAGSVDASGA